MNQLKYLDSFASVGKWSTKDPDHPWTVEKMLTDMERCGIHGALIYSNLAKELQPSIGNDQVFEICQKHPRLLPCWVALPHQCGDFTEAHKFVQGMLDKKIRALKLFPKLHRYSLDDRTSGILLNALQEAEIPAGSLHTWMQYELFRWLISQNCLVAVEPRVSGETGQVFAPDEIVLSHEKGIVSWSPRDFTPYKGWTWYSRPHIPGTPIRFDAVSAKLDDPKEVEIFEIKTEKDFRTEKKVWKVLEQLAKYVSMNLARRFWLVVPDEDRLVSALEEFFEKFSEELFAGSKVGLLAYSLPKRTFRVVTEPKLVQKIKTEDMHVRVM